MARAGETPPLPCVSAAFIAQTAFFAVCFRRLPRPRQRLLPSVSAAFVAQTAPFAVCFRRLPLLRQCLCPRGPLQVSEVAALPVGPDLPTPPPRPAGSGGGGGGPFTFVELFAGIGGFGKTPLLPCVSAAFVTTSLPLLFVSPPPPRLRHRHPSRPPQASGWQPSAAAA